MTQLTTDQSNLQIGDIVLSALRTFFIAGLPRRRRVGLRMWG
jgi:hypothetical protein